MEWMRAKKSKSLVAERVTWESRCRQYRVMLSHIPYAHGLYRGGTHLGYRDRVYAMYFNDIISTHWKKGAAVKACEAHEKNHRSLSYCT